MKNIVKILVSQNIYSGIVRKCLLSFQFCSTVVRQNWNDNSDVKLATVLKLLP